MGYGSLRPARDGGGRARERVGERPSYLHDRVQFPCRPHDPPPNRPISRPFDPPPRHCRRRHSTCDGAPPARGSLLPFPLPTRFERRHVGDPIFVRPPLFLSSPGQAVWWRLYNPPPFPPPPQPEYLRRACPRLLCIHGWFFSFLPPKFSIPPRRCRCLNTYFPRGLPPYTHQKDSGRTTAATAAADCTLQD